MNCKLIFLTLIFFKSVVALAGEDISAGLYQVDIKFNYPKSPIYASVPKESSSKHCLQKGQERKTLMKLMSEQPGCKVLDEKNTDKRTSWKLSCAGGMSTAEGYIDFMKDSFVGENKSKAKIPGSADLLITVKYSGKRIGDCPAPKK